MYGYIISSSNGDHSLPGERDGERDGHLGVVVDEVLAQLLPAGVTDLPDGRRRAKHLHEMYVLAAVCVQVRQCSLHPHADQTDNTPV